MPEASGPCALVITGKNTSILPNPRSSYLEVLDRRGPVDRHSQRQVNPHHVVPENRRMGGGGGEEGVGEGVGDGDSQEKETTLLPKLYQERFLKAPVNVTERVLHTIAWLSTFMHEPSYGALTAHPYAKPYDMLLLFYLIAPT